MPAVKNTYLCCSSEVFQKLTPRESVGWAVKNLTIKQKFSACMVLKPSKLVTKGTLNLFITIAKQ